ncbi:unnamed protein product, partial [Porites lobata]
MKENHEKSEKQLGLKQKKNAYMKEYRRRKKNNEFHSEKLTTRRKQNIYMKEYNNRKKDVATGSKTISREEEQNTVMKEDHAKMSCALHWLVQHNPVYKNITIDYDCLSSLPSEGIPSELHQIDCIENTKDKEMDPDRGPLDVNEIPFNEETELSSTILNPVTLKPQKQLIT